MAWSSFFNNSLDEIFQETMTLDVGFLSPTGPVTVDLPTSRTDPQTPASYVPRPLGSPRKRASSHRERDDRYRRVVFAIPGEDKWRLIVCKDGCQYILQEQEAPNSWQGRRFLSRKDSVARAIEELFGEAVLALLREQISNFTI